MKLKRGKNILKTLKKILLNLSRHYKETQSNNLLKFNFKSLSGQVVPIGYSIYVYIFPSGHGCISDAFLRRLIQRLRDISKRAHLQISETSPWRLIKDVSSETSLRSLRFSQRRLWVASARLILGLQTKALFI